MHRETKMRKRNKTKENQGMGRDATKGREEYESILAGLLARAHSIVTVWRVQHHHPWSLKTFKKLEQFKRFQEHRVSSRQQKYVEDSLLANLRLFRTYDRGQKALKGNWKKCKKQRIERKSGKWWQAQENNKTACIPYLYCTTVPLVTGLTWALHFVAPVCAREFILLKSLHVALVLCTLLLVVKSCQNLLRWLLLTAVDCCWLPLIAVDCRWLPGTSLMRRLSARSSSNP